MNEVTESESYSQKYGWICPYCNTVYSPYVNSCACRRNHYPSYVPQRPQTPDPQPQQPPIEPWVYPNVWYTTSDNSQ